MRDIHACNTQVLHSAAMARDLYAALVENLDRRKVLLFYWNGDRIVLFGDHRYIPTIERPMPEVLAVLHSYGFRWIGYHPYVLVYSPSGMRERIEEIADCGWKVPEGYRFEPDYDGPPEKFNDAFRDVAAGYYGTLDKSELWLLHPGAAKVRRYLVRNFGDYCKVHGMDGAYMDVLGSDADHQFPQERKIVESMDFRHGEAAAQDALHQALPNLATMSEYQTLWMIPRVFYSWEGESHFALPNSYQSIRTRRNHPMRTAIVGSFCWARQGDLDPRDAALIGALPEVVRSDEWSMARAKLFTEEELFNDLPEKWDEQAVACYRGKGGKWFQYRTLPFGDGFVELTADGYRVRLGRFIGQTRGPLDEPAYIQHWIAYKDGKPFGLDAGRIYPFMLQQPQAPGPIRVTDLSAGLCITAVRDLKDFSVVEFGRNGPNASPATATVVFDGPCMRICTAGGDRTGPFEPGKPVEVDVTDGGAVFVWKDLPATDGSPKAFAARAGRTMATGLPDVEYYGGADVSVAPVTIGPAERNALHMGLAHFRTCCQGWMDVPAGSPALTFELGEEDRKPDRLYAAAALAVQVNGREVWRRPLTGKPGWTPQTVPLAPYAGRKVLVTLSLGVEGKRDIAVGVLRPAAYLSNLGLTAPTPPRPASEP